MEDAVPSTSVRAPDATTEYASPLEREIARVWAEVLSVEYVGRHDNFFELGGHSMLMIQIASRLWETSGVELSIDMFLDEPTVAGLAVLIARQQREATPAQGGPYAVAREPTGLDTGPAAASDTFRANVGTCAAVGANIAVITTPTGIAALTPEEVELLVHCGVSRTLHDHARAIVSTRGEREDRVAAVRERLEVLVESGALLRGHGNPPESRALSRAGATPAGRSISALALLTCNRPKALDRALVGYLDNLRAADRRCDVVVMDDSPDPDMRERNRATVDRHRLRHGAAVSYCGFDEKQRLVDDLVRWSVPRDVVEFAVDGKRWGTVSTGANRNALLLSRAGDLLVSVDDDTECRIVQAPAPAPGIAIVSGCASSTDPVTPASLWTFSDRQQAIDASVTTAGDFVATHEAYLGAAVRDVLSEAVEHGVPLDFHGAEPAMLARVAAFDQHIRLTVNGIVGDVGWDSPSHYLWLTGRSRERLTASQEAYRAACATREVLKVVERPTITDGSRNLMTTCLGLDTREVLPPFMPAGRGQDVAFGTVVSLCCRGVCFAHVPWAVLHAASGRPVFEPVEVVKAAMGLDLAVVLVSCIRATVAASSCPSGANGLLELGRELEEVATRPPQAFAEWLRSAVWSELDVYLSALEAVESPPVYVATDIDRLITVLRRSLTRAEYYVPVEFLTGQTIEAAMARTADYIAHYGRLCQWWPAMIEAARATRHYR